MWDLFLIHWKPWLKKLLRIFYFVAFFKKNENYKIDTIFAFALWCSPQNVWFKFILKLTTFLLNIVCIFWLGGWYILARLYKLLRACMHCSVAIVTIMPTISGIGYFLHIKLCCSRVCHYCLPIKTHTTSLCLCSPS